MFLTMKVQQNLFNTSDKILIPAIKVLNQPIHPSEKTPTEPIETTLESMFPEQSYEEKDIKQAKEILGDLATEFTPQELKYELIKIQFLVESWLDEFERNTFQGKTLRELLHEKGGL